MATALKPQFEMLKHDSISIVASIGPITFVVIRLFTGGLAFIYERWRSDSKIIRSAEDWCRANYPEMGRVPIVDLLVAIARKSEIEWDALTPASLLTKFNVKPRFGGSVKDYELPKQWIEDLSKDARINLTERPEFNGTTLDDAIRYLATYATM
jgi:hypothetical protein